MMSFESSSLCEISPKYFFHSRMKRGGRHSGPKRSTQRRGKEYKRIRKVQVMAARAKKMEDNARDERWEMIHAMSQEVAAAMFLKTQFQETADMNFILGAYEKRLVMFIMMCGSQEIPHQVSILLCRVIVRA